ncbi:FxSxx-COOH system tetratricopeptide repeat protein [Dactylosporangium sp. CA-092794]|uniref:FxSxx-COOH system tetratricopeptide repeat protein n=1 Tax=Dactylosporangium sp. CA-092794 TaxID=3239929 RepID=UPI003D8AD876
MAVPAEEGDFVAELQLLWRAAGRPSYRRISNEIRERADLPEKVSHETVGSLLAGEVIPRWSKVEPVVRQMAAMAVHHPDVEDEVLRFHELWAALGDSPEDGVPDERAPGDVAPARPPMVRRVSPMATAERPPPPDPTSTGDLQFGALPPRNPEFTGREDVLGAMRAKLTGEPWRPLVLHGLSGVGKTSIATEFVYRERDGYDLVWWITAEQVSQVRSALVTLGERREWEASQDMRRTISGVLSRLESADFRWLIVFDNATRPEDIEDLVPAAGGAGGAVIVTTRDAAWLDRGRGVTVAVLSRAESIRLLQRRGGISFDEADQLAERLGDLPLALEQAAAMRAAAGITVQEFLARLDVHATAVLDQGRPGDYPKTVANAFGVTFNQLRRESAVATQLLAMLSCLSAEPVSLTLLRAADNGAIPPPLGRLLGQDEHLQGAIRVLGRYGLLTAIDEGQRVLVHRLVQLIVRDSLSRAERELAYDNARRLLVAANPGQPDETLTWEMHAQIGPHVEPARLVDSTDPAARGVVLDQARYLYMRGDFDGSLRLSQRARRAWAGPEDDWADEQMFICVDRVANALQGLGRYQEASDLYERAWIRVNQRFGEDHRRTARLANGVAATRRLLGRYAEALKLEQYRVRYYEQANPGVAEDLFHARNNLAVNLRAVGDFRQAYDIDRQLVDDRTQANGADHFRTLLSVSNLARDLYGLGEFAEALRVQAESLPAMLERLNSRHPLVMLATRTICLGLRKTGQLAEALDASREHFYKCQGEFGSDHANTLAAAMTYANAVRARIAAEPTGGGESLNRAYNLSVDTMRRYRRFGERNPLALVAAINHAAILRAMGERRGARYVGEPAYQALYRQLGAGHPYTQAAAVGLANDLFAAHEDDDAVRLLRATLDSARDAGRADHPDMLVCAVNLALISHESGAAGSSIASLRDAVGAGHPLVEAAQRDERGECDIEPPPL